MTAPLLLPIRTQGFDPVMRLVADLAAAHARGQDLGSRVPHIQAGSERILELSRTLDSAIGDLEALLSKIGLHDPALIGCLKRFVDQTRSYVSQAENCVTKANSAHLE